MEQSRMGRCRIGRESIRSAMEWCRIGWIEGSIIGITSHHTSRLMPCHMLCCGFHCPLHSFFLLTYPILCCQTPLYLIRSVLLDLSCVRNYYPSSVSKSSFDLDFCPSFPCAVTSVNCPSPSSSSPSAPTLSLLPLSKPGSCVPWTSGSLL